MGNIVQPAANNPALFNMVEQQIRTWEVLDQRLLDTITQIPRASFVLQAYHNLAYADTSITLDHDQLMMPPKLEARMMQALEIKPDDTILEVGTGSGYVTALMASLGKQVYSVDIFPDFVAAAEIRCKGFELRNITFEVGDAAQGWEHHAPYDVIAITGSLPVSADPFKTQLRTGGRLFAIIGSSPVMNASLIRRLSEDQWSEDILFETELPALHNAIAAQKFIF